MRKKIFVQTQCTNCGEEIKHSILTKVKGYTDDKEIPTYFMILECEGCEEISFLMREYLTIRKTSASYIDSRYPMEDEFDFLNDNELDYLPSKIYNFYSEVKKSFVSDSNVMASLGLRTLIEAICVHKKINGNNLVQKITVLQKQGLISNIEFETLHKLRLLGNSSAHEIKPHSLEKLSYGLEVVNHVLRSMYILPKINKKLKT